MGTRDREVNKTRVRCEFQAAYFVARNDVDPIAEISPAGSLSLSLEPRLDGIIHRGDNFVKADAILASLSPAIGNLCRGSFTREQRLRSRESERGTDARPKFHS